jgi:hypothetical protein
MKKILYILLLCCVNLINADAEKIYLINSPGYNTATTAMIAAFSDIGHTVVVNSTSPYTIPDGFTSTCVDPVNGYDWLAFFGNTDFSDKLPQIEAFLNAGGKVYYQYEVSCCTVASAAIAKILSSLTGLNITPNSHDYIALTGSGPSGFPGWEARNIGCCGNFFGNAYKGLDGMPVKNQLQATATTNNSTPPITTCLNFGFLFNTTDFNFPGTTHKGSISGVGDNNVWFDAREPSYNIVDTALVHFVFPTRSSKCLLMPLGCIEKPFDLNNQTQTVRVNLGKDTAICQGQTLVLDVSLSNGSYVWQDSSTASIYDITNPGKYWVRVKNNCGTGSDTINVSYTTPLTLHLGNDTTLCPGEALTLNTNIANASFLWQDNSISPTYNVTQEGKYWVNVTNSCGTKTDTINISYYSPLSVDLGIDTTLCPEATYLLNASNANATYLWQDNSNKSTYTVRKPGTYWVKVKDYCTTRTDTVKIGYISPLSVSLGRDTSLCKGDTLELNEANPNSTYLWQDNSTKPTFVIKHDGKYWVKVTNRCQSKSDTLEVNYNLLKKTFRDTIICPGSTLTLDAFSRGATYLWQDNSTEATYTVKNTGIYWVKISIRSCSITDSINVDDYVLNQRLDLGKDTTIDIDASLTLHAGREFKEYKWQDGTTDSTLTVNKKGEYKVITTDINGCKYKDSIHLDVTCYSKDVFLPNVFTPDNPKSNCDLYFRVEGRCIGKTEVTIFNRWGEKVYTNNYDFSDYTDDKQCSDRSHDDIVGNYRNLYYYVIWDGTDKKNGGKVSEGTYYYILTYNITDNKETKKLTKKGSVSVVK